MAEKDSINPISLEWVGIQKIPTRIQLNLVLGDTD